MDDESTNGPNRDTDREDPAGDIWQPAAGARQFSIGKPGHCGYSFPAQPEGPMSRLVDGFGVPLPTESELARIPAAARGVMTELATASKSAERAICDEIRAHARPIRFERDEWLEELGEGGPDPDQVIGVVPRVWLLDHVAMDMGHVERQELRLTPTVVLATSTAIYWATPGDGPGWASIPVGGEEGESVPDWSELFGRGPFAAFADDDLGVDAQEGSSELFDMFLVDEQVLPSTLYGFVGASPTNLLITITGESSRSYGEARVKEGVKKVTTRVRDAFRQLREEGGAPDGFVDDLFALGPHLLPFLLSGGFQAFLPLGLDPQARSAFRYPNLTQSASAAGLLGERLDAVGEPMRMICGRRGMTLPMFIEPTGRSGGSHMKVMLQSLRAARHVMREGASAADGGCIYVRAGRDGLELRKSAEVAAYPLQSGVDEARRAKRDACERALSSPYPAEPSAGQVAALDAVLQEQPADAISPAERARGEEVLAEQSLRLEEIDAFLVRNPGNAEAHLERAKVLRVLKFGSSSPIDAAREAVRLDPSPGKYWILALAHDDADEVEERDRAIVAGRSLWTESSELVDLWQRSSYQEVFDFSSAAERVANREASEEEALAHLACVRRALRLMPETRPDEDLALRQADIRATGMIGEQRAWFLGVCQDAIRTYHRSGAVDPDDRGPFDAWFYYLYMMDQGGETPSTAVMDAAAVYLTAGDIEVALGG